MWHQVIRVQVCVLWVNLFNPVVTWCFGGGWNYDFDLTRWSGLIFQEQCVISSAPHFFFILYYKGESDQEDEKQLFKFNFTSFSVFGSCQLQDLVENNNVERTWDDIYSELETWNLHKNWSSSNDWEKLWDILKKTFASISQEGPLITSSLTNPISLVF